MSDSAPRAQRMWPVAKIGEVPRGGRKVVEVAGRSIGLFNVNGNLVAALNVCPHEGAPVCMGRVSGTTLPSPPGEFRWGREGEILTCPWHGWEFALLTGRALADKHKRLRLYPVTVENDTLFVTI